MCQMSVFTEDNGQEEMVMEGVTLLEVIDNGVRLSTFFEEPLEINGVQVSRIDFTEGRACLTKVGIKTGQT